MLWNVDCSQSLVGLAVLSCTNQKLIKDWSRCSGHQQRARELSNDSESISGLLPSPEGSTLRLGTHFHVIPTFQVDGFKVSIIQLSVGDFSTREGLQISL